MQGSLLNTTSPFGLDPSNTHTLLGSALTPDNAHLLQHSSPAATAAASSNPVEAHVLNHSQGSKAVSCNPVEAHVLNHSQAGRAASSNPVEAHVLNHSQGGRADNLVSSLTSAIQQGGSNIAHPTGLTRLHSLLATSVGGLSRANSSPRGSQANSVTFPVGNSPPHHTGLEQDAIGGFSLSSSFRHSSQKLDPQPTSRHAAPSSVHRAHSQRQSTGNLLRTVSQTSSNVALPQPLPQEPVVGRVAEGGGGVRRRRPVRRCVSTALLIPSAGGVGVGVRAGIDVDV